MRKLMVMWLCMVLLFSSVIVISVSDNVEAKIITVDDSGGADYTNIQEAIDNAESGDTIFVYEGTYYENVIINKTIYLEGENKESTIINGSKTGTVLNVNQTSDVLISNFTLEWSGFGSSSICVGYYVSESNNCSILNCNIPEFTT